MLTLNNYGQFEIPIRFRTYLNKNKYPKLSPPSFPFPTLSPFPHNPLLLYSLLSCTYLPLHLPKAQLISINIKWLPPTSWNIKWFLSLIPVIFLDTLCRARLFIFCDPDIVWPKGCWSAPSLYALCMALNKKSDTKKVAIFHVSVVQMHSV